MTTAGRNVLSLLITLILLLAVPGTISFVSTILIFIMIRVSVGIRTREYFWAGR